MGSPCKLDCTEKPKSASDAPSDSICGQHMWLNMSSTIACSLTKGPSWSRDPCQMAPSWSGGQDAVGVVCNGLLRDSLIGCNGVIFGLLRTRFFIRLCMLNPAGGPRCCRRHENNVAGSWSARSEACRSDTTTTANAACRVARPQHCSMPQCRWGWKSDHVVASLEVAMARTLSETPECGQHAASCPSGKAVRGWGLDSVVLALVLK